MDARRQTTDKKSILKASPDGRSGELITEHLGSKPKKIRRTPKFIFLFLFRKISTKFAVITLFTLWWWTDFVTPYVVFIGLWKKWTTMKYYSWSKTQQPNYIWHEFPWTIFLWQRKIYRSFYLLNFIGRYAHHLCIRIQFETEDSKYWNWSKQYWFSFPK